MRTLARRPWWILVLACACNRSPEVSSNGVDAAAEASDDANKDPATVPTTDASPPPSNEPTPEDRSREPVVLELEGWPPSQDSTNGDHRLLVYDGKQPGCSVRVDRWWGMPPTPGGPMEIASKRTITVDGRQLELLETRAFEGVTQTVQVVFHRGEGFQVRVVFDGCPTKIIDEILELTRITA